MSTKDNIDYIKKELTSQEKLLQGLFHFEKFYKKKQKTIIISIAVALMLIGIYFIKIYIDKNNNIKANIAFNNLINNKYSKNDEDNLKKYNIDLYNIYRFKKVINSKKYTKMKNCQKILCLF